MTKKATKIFLTDTKPTKFSFTNGRKQINGRVELQMEMLPTNETQNGC